MGAEMALVTANKNKMTMLVNGEIKVKKSAKHYQTPKEMRKSINKYLEKTSKRTHDVKEVLEDIVI